MWYSSFTCRPVAGRQGNRESAPINLRVQLRDSIQIIEKKGGSRSLCQCILFDVGAYPESDTHEAERACKGQPSRPLTWEPGIVFK